MTPVHSSAAVGFEAGAGTYARGRPDYPAALDPWLRDALGIRPGVSVVDLGAGTGKFTARLAAAGAHVTAVEPVAAMRTKLAELLPSVSVRDGTAEATGLPGGSADVVVCAQAFHWFATPVALAEIARILIPGGRLGLVWNVRDLNTTWVAEIDSILREYEGDSPRYFSGAWRRVFPAPQFTALEETVFPHRHTGPPEQVIVDRQLSVSFIAALPPAQQDNVAARVRDVIAHTPDLRGKTEVTFPYLTHAFVARRR